MTCACGSNYKWSYDTTIKTDRDDRRFKVDVYKCEGCGTIFFVDKDMKKPPKEKQPPYVPTVQKNTYDEAVFYGIMYINSKGKLGSKPKDYVSTKPYVLNGITYPPIRKARVRGKKK